MPGRSEQPPPESGARRAPGSPRRLSTRCCAAVHGSSRLKRRNLVGPVVGRGAHVAGKEGGRGSGRCPRRGHGVSGSLDPVFLCRLPPGASPLMRGRGRTRPVGEPGRELASAAGTPPLEPHCWLGAPPPVAAGVRLSPGVLVRTACDYHSRWSTSERHGGTLRRRGRGGHRGQRRGLAQAGDDGTRVAGLRGGGGVCSASWSLQASFWLRGTSKDGSSL